VYCWPRVVLLSRDVNPDHYNLRRQLVMVLFVQVGTTMSYSEYIGNNLASLAKLVDIGFHLAGMVIMN
jgi:hypothetical protein